ncbi:condensation domain-containing protein, partial [Nonomuraea sp. NPDC049784]|uniref:condensation domain-containing protein n=1 Tax=Nonomuraea sp. NPDC049784 TaxID=3154361 RepID=UPI0033F96852
ELRAAAGARNQPARMFAQIAQTLFAARPGSVQGLLDSVLLTGADWREVEAPRQRPARRHQAPAGAHDRRLVRWPASREAAHRAAAAIEPIRQEVVPAAIFVAPETAVERRITAVWEETLGVQPIGVTDDLVALGGDSLTAALICVRLREADLLLTVSELLQQPTVRGCARLARPAASAAALTDGPADSGAPLAASLGQGRVWAAENIQQHTNNQVIPTAHHITGPLDLGRLRRALEDVVARHPALRTTLDDRDGQVRCRLTATAAFDLECTDLMDGPALGRDEAAERAARAFFATRFDLEQGPMLRAVVLRLAADRHLLLMSAHHSACDGWSMEVVHRDLSIAYTAPGARADPPPAPFSHYQRSLAVRIERGDFDAAVEEIHHALRPPPARAALRVWDATGSAPHHVRFELDLPLTHSVRAAAQGHATTPFHLYLAAFQLLLAAAADTTSLVSGTPVANRHDPAYADTVGFIANLVPIRARIDWSADLGVHLQTAIASSTRALRHSDVPYGLLTQTHPAPGGLFDNLFTLQPPAFHPLALDGCQVTPVEPAQWPQPYPLMLDLREHLDGASVLLRIDTRAHEPGRADWIVEAYPLVLQAISSRPGLLLKHLRTALHPSPRA